MKKSALVKIHDHGNVDEKLSQKFSLAEKKENSFSDFIKEFLGGFLSERTRRAYQKDFTLFVNFLARGGLQLTHPQQITSYHFQFYRDELIEKKYAPATINRRLVVIRSFMKWALAHKLIPHNPLDAIKLPKTATITPTQAFSDEEVRALLKAPDIKTPQGNMHRMALYLLFYLGLRRSELIAIKQKDIYEERHHYVLEVLGKGGKKRLIPLPPIILQEHREYLKRYRHFYQTLLTPEDYLLQGHKNKKGNKPLHGSTIYRIVVRYARECGVLKNVGAHSCRATAISHLLDTQKSPIRDVAIFAGHSNIATTERYDKKRKELDDNPVYKIGF